MKKFEELCVELVDAVEHRAINECENRYGKSVFDEFETRALIANGYMLGFECHFLTPVLFNDYLGRECKSAGGLLRKEIARDRQALYEFFLLYRDRYNSLMGCRWSALLWKEFMLQVEEDLWALANGALSAAMGGISIPSLGHSACVALKDLSLYVANLWLQEWSDKYALYIHTSAVEGSPDGVVLGNNFRHFLDLTSKTVSYEETIKAIQTVSQSHVDKIIIFNKDIAYMLKLDAGGVLTVELQSLVIPSSPIKVLVARYDTKTDKWRLEFDPICWPDEVCRGLHGLSLEMSRCVRMLMILANEIGRKGEDDYMLEEIIMTSPINQPFANAFKKSFARHKERELWVEVTSTGINVNGWLNL